MKKILFLILTSAILFACNQIDQKPADEGHTSHEDAVGMHLSLNNGAKWKADSITNHNVVNLKTIADNFRIKPFPSVTDYQILSTDLNDGVNKMIKECKMSGPDHDALHQWLEPVITETNQLKTLKDTSAAKNTFISIDKRIDAYNNYFE